MLALPVSWGHELRGDASAVRKVLGVTGQFSAVDKPLARAAFRRGPR